LTMLSECTYLATFNDYVFARAQVTNYKGNVAPANAFTKVVLKHSSAYSCHDLPTSIQQYIRSQHMSQPLTEKLNIFYGHPSSPPEGVRKQIHVDKHWTDCPWVAYWNLNRGTPTHQADMEYGASFFISLLSMQK